MPAWTAPITWVLNQVVTIAHMNAYWRDNFLVLDQHAHTGNPGEGALLPSDAVAGTPSLRSLGAGAQQAAAGNHGPHVTLPPEIAAKVRKAANQSIPNGALTALIFDAEDWDTDTMHDNAVNNSRLTCKTAGKFEVGFSGVWGASGSGTRHHRLRVNGGSDIAAVNVPGNASDGGAYHSPVCFSKEVLLGVNDYVEVHVWQDSGGALDMAVVGAASMQFWMRKVD